MGVPSKPSTVTMNGAATQFQYDDTNKVSIPAFKRKRNKQYIILFFISPSATVPRPYELRSSPSKTVFMHMDKKTH